MAYQCRWCVIGPRQLAFGPFGTLAGVIDGKCENPERSVGFDYRAKLQQALVDRTKFLRVHVPVIYAGKAPTRPEKGKVAYSFQQALIGDGRSVEVGTVIGPEKSSKRWQAKAGCALCKSTEGDLDPLP